MLVSVNYRWNNGGTHRASKTCQFYLNPAVELRRAGRNQLFVWILGILLIANIALFAISKGGKYERKTNKGTAKRAMGAVWL